MKKHLGLFFLGILTFALSLVLIGLALTSANSSWSTFVYWVSQQTFVTPKIINILENMPDFLRFGVGFFAYVIPILLGLLSLVISVVFFMEHSNHSLILRLMIMIPRNLRLNYSPQKHRINQNSGIHRLARNREFFLFPPIASPNGSQTVIFSLLSAN